MQIELSENGFKGICGQIITGNKINSFNDFGNPEEVSLKEFSGYKRTGNSIDIKLPSKSVVLIKIKK